MRLENNHEPRTRHSTNGSSSRHASPSSSPHANGAGGHQNGTTDRDTNGYHSNGLHSSSSPTHRNLEPFHGHDREEVTRLLLQSLSDLGYHEAAKRLSDESGFALEMASVAAFRSAILSGDWEEAELLLFGPALKEVDEGGVMLGNGHHTTHSPSWRKRVLSSASSQNGFPRHGLPLAETADTTAMKFLIRQQKYLELLEGRELNAALAVLRNELTPLNRDVGRLHALSSLMMCPTIASLLTQANWDGSVGGSRTRLLSDLSRSISPSIMIPEHRLATLLTAVQSNQVVSCRYHNTTIQPSLYTDHECSADDFPLQELITLKAHSDEVWYLEFSHDGTMLATAGKDGLVCVYDTARWKTMHEFREHEKNPSGSGHRGVCCVAFSPDDRYLISCSQNNEFAVLDVRDGRCVSRADHFDYPVTCAAWLPDSLTFVIGTQGSRRPLGIYYLRSSSSSSSSTSNGTSTTSSAIVKNNELHSFRDPAWDPNEKNNSFRISDVAVSADGTRMAAATTDNKILMYDLPKREKIAQWQMEDRLTSVNFDSSGAHMIVNMHKGKVLLLSAEVDARGNVAEVEVKCRYEGVVQDEFVIRSCFGGAGEDLVVSGSEDANVFIWRRQTGIPVASFEAHPHGTVNAVAWHPTNDAMFATAGDDRKVKIWTSASAIRAMSAASRTSLGLHYAGR